MNYVRVMVGVVALCLIVGTISAQAGPYIPRGPFVTPLPSSAVPGPPNVPGKEYSDDSDKDGITGAVDPERVIAWDGAAGIQNAFDYSGSRAGDPEEYRQVDALANCKDALFDEVISNQSALLFSVDDESGGGVSSPYIFYEHINGPPAAPPAWPGGPIWAKPLVHIDQHNVTDVDGLEVWGPEHTESDGHRADANRYSLEGDPAIGAGAKVSVWAYDFKTPASTPYITAAQIAAAIDPEDGTLPLYIDLDGMMISDVACDDDFDTTAESNDYIMFTIVPITTASNIFDGGEIWVWKGSNPLATFLVHGGHTWDTAFDVKGSFGVDSENVNALESSAPEPSTLVLLALGGLTLAVLAWARRRRRKA